MRRGTMTEPAVINYGPEPGAVELRDFTPPEIGDDDILMEVGAVGVCGSDLHQWQSLHSWNVNYPIVLGHEFAGTIAQVGRNVKNWREGDRVASETAAVIDVNNPMSKVGLYNLDPTRRGFGAHVNGAMTKRVRVPARCLHRVPDQLPFEKAALTEPCCVAYNTVVGNSSIEPGDRIVVFGPGPIGLLCAAIARLQGATVAVAGLERDAARFEIARKYGCATLTDDVQEWARQGDGLGVDGVIDAAGVSATLKTAIEIVRPNGWITKVGWGRDPLGFSLDPLVLKNIKLQGSFSHNWPIWERVIQLLAGGTLDVSPIIGGTWPLTEWEEAFEAMHSGKIAKSVLIP
ncbi:MAG: zinc-binding dehydrogenase [Planctomycetaceae bacterium]|nr:zinc-binding dehydrogenase [Planctomycetaceae bacterium]